MLIYTSWIRGSNALVSDRVDSSRFASQIGFRASSNRRSAQIYIYIILTAETMTEYVCDCGKVNHYPDSCSGQKEVCDACGRTYVVPFNDSTNDGFDDGTADVDMNPSYRAGTSSSCSVGSDLSEEKIVFQCNCGKEYRFSKRFVGRITICVDCKHQFVVPPPYNPTVFPEDDSPYDFSSDEGIARSIGVAGEPVVEPESSQKIGRYIPRGAIGKGGMGKLISVWDTHLHREVALKQVDKNSGSTFANSKARLIQEARIAGSLTHPNIIPIYSLEYDEEGDPFYTMQLLEGSSFAFKIKQYHHGKIKNVTLRELLRHFVVVCRMIAYAHEKGILHRDIKPSNIYLDGFGKPYVIDWGLAKPATQFGETELNDMETTVGEAEHETDDGNVDLTMAGKLVGTYCFQSPEYRRTRQSQRSDDVYALGVTLYYVLCGKLPYGRTDIRHGKQKELPKISKTLNKEVDVPLAAICLKSLEYDVSKRYKSADELADLIEAWLDDKPMPGHTFVERWTRICRTKSAAYYRVIGGGIAVVALILGIVLGKL